MIVRGAFMVLMMMLIGASLLNPINTAVSVMATPTYSSPVISLAALIPLIAVVVVLIRSFDEI